MANLKNLSIKNAKLMILKGSVSGKGFCFFVGLNMEDAPSDQIWLLNEKVEGVSKKHLSVAIGLAKNIQTKGSVNLVDDFDVNQEGLQRVMTIQ